VTLHIRFFDGGSAFSAFKSQGLLAKLQAVCPEIQSFTAHHIYLLATEQPLATADHQRMAQLLDVQSSPSAAAAAGVSCVVSPRMGTVSPWASKATDIARNCGFKLRRLERLTEFHLQSLKPSLSASVTSALQALLHDRMTESVWPNRQDAQSLLTSPWPLWMSSKVGVQPW